MNPKPVTRSWGPKPVTRGGGVIVSSGGTGSTGQTYTIGTGTGTGGTWITSSNATTTGTWVIVSGPAMPRPGNWSGVFKGRIGVG